MTAWLLQYACRNSLLFSVGIHETRSSIPNDVMRFLLLSDIDAPFHKYDPEVAIGPGRIGGASNKNLITLSHRSRLGIPVMTRRTEQRHDVIRGFLLRNKLGLEFYDFLIVKGMGQTNGTGLSSNPIRAADGSTSEFVTKENLAFLYAAMHNIAL